jgi:hypothetical protein
MEGPQPGEFAPERHVAFIQMLLHELPREYAPQEINHLTLAYFAVSSLSLLRSLDRVNFCILTPQLFLLPMLAGQ